MPHAFPDTQIDGGFGLSPDTGESAQPDSSMSRVPVVIKVGGKVASK
ncbi:MAG: hypothetical protein QNK92_06055 [Amylibacter sp.]